MELRRRVGRARCGRPFQVQRVGVRDGLHEPAGADAHRHRRPRHPQRRGRDDSRRRSRETSRVGRGFEAGGHLAWLDATYDRYIAVALGGATGDVSGNRLNNAPEWAGRLWIEWTGDIGPRAACRCLPSRRHSRRCSIPRSTTTSSVSLRTACWVPASNTDPAIAAGLSVPTHETSRTRTTSRRRSGRRPPPSPDVPALRASSRLISASGDSGPLAHFRASSKHTTSPLVFRAYTFPLANDGAVKALPSMTCAEPSSL